MSTGISKNTLICGFKGTTSHTEPDHCSAVTVLASNHRTKDCDMKDAFWSVFIFSNGPGRSITHYINHTF